MTFIHSWLFIYYKLMNSGTFKYDMHAQNMYRLNDTEKRIKWEHSGA